MNIEGSTIDLFNRAAAGAEWKEAFQQYMDRTRLLYGNGKELGFVCFRCDTTEKMDYRFREDDNREVSIGKWFESEPLSTIHGFVHVVRSNFGVKRFVTLHLGIIIASASRDSTKTRLSPNTDSIVKLKNTKDNNSMKDPELNIFF